MPKIPDSVPVKVTVSKITLEVPKSFFEHAALRAAIFVGRKGRSAATRRTKWFTLADPALVGSRTRQSVALPASHLGGSRRGSAVIEAEASGEHHVEDVAVEMAVLEYSGMNNVVYEVDMKPLNIFDGDWVFDQKTTHPLSVFAKILVRGRPGERAAGGAKSEQESNLNEMLHMDQDDMDSEDDSDNFSNEHGEGGNGADLEMSLSGIGLSEAQMAALAGEENSNEMVMNQLRRGVDCKRRYLQFPKTIDMASIVNTKAKTADFCERLQCKNAALLGSTLSFTVTAELPQEKLTKFEDKVKTKEEEKEMKRREKEEKVLEKERKKEDKEEAKRREKEEKKRGTKLEKSYGADVTDAQNPSGAKNELRAPPAPQEASTPDSAKKKKSGFSPLNLVKGIFTKEEKPEKTTPFAVKLTTTAYPFLVMLSDFELSKLVMEPQNYRAVHIRLGTDSASTDDFPRLLLDTTKPSAKVESTVTWFDGTTRPAISFKFDTARIFFGDKALRNITGFETLRALQEHEKHYHEARRDALEGSTSQRRESVDSDLFHEQLMNVGTHFHPIAYEATKYSANGNQALPTKFTRVTAQLIVADKAVGEVRPSDLEEKKAYVRKLKKEQKQREKEEKERAKAEKEAEKAARKAEAKKHTEAGEAGDHIDGAEAAEAAQEVADSSTPKSGGTPSTTAANHNASPDAAAAKDSDEDSSDGAKEQAAGAEANFEAGAADHLDATETVAATPESTKKEKKEKRESDGSKVVFNKSNSFQLSTYAINEDYMPEEGVQYRILFQTGEELSFRARRFFLPSVCAFGADGCTREPTFGDYMNATMN